MNILNRDSYRIKATDRVFCVQCQCKLWPKDRVFPLGEDSFCSPACRESFEHALETLAESDQIESAMAGSLALRLASVALKPQPAPVRRRTPWDYPS